VRMDGSMSLTEAHDRASAIERSLKEKYGPCTHVTIHMEPRK
jgi:divalent metal cation (Fe/Co/Zn/Cd) transporter